MSGWFVGEENSGGQLDRRLMRRLPVARRQLSDGLIGRGVQALQHVPEIRMGFDAVQPAVGDERVDHRAALARFFWAEKQPVPFPNGRWPNRVLDQIVVDLHFAVLQEAFQPWPLVQA